MSKSLVMYGHDQPCLFYTDNVTDRAFLKKCFPSLREGVIPVEKHGHLPPFAIPDSVNIIPLSSKAAIDDAMRSIVASVPRDSPARLVVGLDTEWNVNMSDRGFITGRGKTTVVQIAFDK